MEKPLKREVIRIFNYFYSKKAESYRETMFILLFWGTLLFNLTLILAVIYGFNWSLLFNFTVSIVVAMSSLWFGKKSEEYDNLIES